MKITNETRYDQRILRSIFLAVVADVQKVLGRDQPLAVKAQANFIRKSCHVTVSYTRHGGTSGWAAFSGARAKIRVQREEVSVVELIWLVRHEVYHLFDVRHEQMPDAVNHRSNAAFNTIYERFGGLIERLGLDAVLTEAPKVQKPKPSTDEKRVTKLASINERIERWEWKARRAENALKKLRKQRRYYEGALAAKGPTS